MKHLLSGVALAAIIALAAPVWAQAPTTAASPASSPTAAPNTTQMTAPAKPAMPHAATGAGMSTASTATAPRRHGATSMRQAHRASQAGQLSKRQAGPQRFAYHRALRHRGVGWEGGSGGGSNDRMADRLNAEELNRLTTTPSAGGTTPMAAPATTPSAGGATPMAAPAAAPQR